MEKNICAMGIDLTGEYMQISCQERSGMEPVSLSTSPEEQKYLIPSVLYHRKENDTWYIGDEAIFNSNSDKKTYYRFDEDIKDDIELMVKLFEKLMEKAKNIAGFERVEVICISMEDCDLNITGNVYEAFETLGYAKERIKVINHDEAFIYYTINQKKELWTNDVILFDLTENHFRYRRLHEMKSKTPPVLYVSSSDLSDDINYEMLETENGRYEADSIMVEHLRKELKKNVVCTIFLTGQGFYEDWYTESLKEMQGGRRRIFKGYNLFVKGACYAAVKKYQGITEKSNILQCKGRTKADIGLLIRNQGKSMIIALSNAGTNWYEAGAKAECILDNITRINIVIVSAIDGSSKDKIIDVSGFPKRPNKTTKVGIMLAYKDDDTFDIIVQDKGFGELFKATDAMVKETISVSELLGD